LAARRSVAAILAKVSDPSNLVEETNGHGVEHLRELAGDDVRLHDRKGALTERLLVRPQVLPRLLGIGRVRCGVDVVANVPGRARLYPLSLGLAVPSRGAFLDGPSA
jgi:hypothetical protein